RYGRGSYRTTDPRFQLAHLADQIVTVLTAHADVGQQNLRSPGLETRQRLASGIHALRLRAVPVEERSQEIAAVGIVVDNQDRQTSQVRNAVRACIVIGYPEVLKIQGRSD